MTAIVKANAQQVINVEIFGDTLIDEFIASRHATGNTEKTYRNVIRQLVKHFAATNVTMPTSADVDGFINKLRGAKKSDSTIRIYSAVTKLYFAFLAKKGAYADVAADTAPLKLRKATTHKKNALSETQARAMLTAIKGTSLTELRDKAVIALALQTGVRTIEIERANVGDFYPNDDGEGYLLAVTGKGHVEADATVRVVPVVVEMIKSYLAKRAEITKAEITADEPLFISTSRNNSKYGNRFSAQSVQKLIKRVMVEVGIRNADPEKDVNKKITPHSCRHYAATTAIKAGVDIREVAEMLRHRAINVTVVYLNDLSAKTRQAELSVAASLFGGLA